MKEFVIKREYLGKLEAVVFDSYDNEKEAKEHCDLYNKTNSSISYLYKWVVISNKKESNELDSK